MAVIDRVKGRIVEYDERTNEAIIRAPADFVKLVMQEQKEVWIEFIDSRPLSDKQRRSCYAMIREIADWQGDMETETQDTMVRAFHQSVKKNRAEAVKEWAKLRFWCDELQEMADRMFSLSDAPMSIVAAFQSWLARFIVRNDIPTNHPMLEYVDDIDDYVYACLINKKCPICGRKADLHHWEAIGMGRDRDSIIHEGMEVMPLCREHHMEVHTTGRSEFVKKYHLNDHGIPADKTICKLYELNTKKRSKAS